MNKTITREEFLTIARGSVAAIEKTVPAERRGELRLMPLPFVVERFAVFAEKSSRPRLEIARIRIAARQMADAGLTWADLDGPSGASGVQA